MSSDAKNDDDYAQHQNQCLEELNHQQQESGFSLKCSKLLHSDLHFFRSISFSFFFFCQVFRSISLCVCVSDFIKFLALSLISLNQVHCTNRYKTSHLSRMMDKKLMKVLKRVLRGGLNSNN